MRLVRDVNNDARLSYAGVTVARETQIAMDTADKLHWEIAGREAEITSIVDGQHSTNSRHYVGLAFDLRIWYLPDPKGFVAELQERLGDSYVVILEKDHIHVQFSPKRN